MYNEYPDLIYEGFISDVFFTEIVEEGIGESIKNGLGRLKTFANKFIEKVMEKLRQLMFNIKKFFNRFKNNSKEVKEQENSSKTNETQSQSYENQDNNINDEEDNKNIDTTTKNKEEPELKKRPIKKEESKVKVAIFIHKYDIDAESTENFMNNHLMTFLLIEKQLKDIYELIKKSQPGSANKDYVLKKDSGFDEKTNSFYDTVNEGSEKLDEIFGKFEEIPNDEIIRKYVTEDYRIVDHKEVEIEYSNIDSIVMHYSKITKNTLEKCEKALDTLRSCNTSINNIINNINKIIKKQRETYKQRTGTDSSYREIISKELTLVTQKSLRYLNKLSSLFTEIVGCVSEELNSIKIVR